MLGLEAHFDVLQIAERAHQQAGTRKEHESQCDFADDQPVAKPGVTCGVCGAAAARVSQRRIHVGAQSGKRWGQSENQRGDHGRAGGEGQDAEVEMNRLQAR